MIAIRTNTPSRAAPGSRSEKSGCPCGCRAEQVEIGPLPGQIETFGGHPLESPVAAGSLWHCPECDLRYRFPYLSQEEMSALYQKLPLSIWQHPQPPEFWKLILEYASLAPGRKVLDVGCYTGDLLAWLPGEWERFGVEPSREAGRVASQKGIRILGSELEDIPEGTGPFDCIVMTDVLEHMRDPLALIKEARKHLSSKGILIILTGAADAFWPRVFGRYYWYCNLPEHVVWVTQRWMENAAEWSGMRVQRFSYVSCADSLRQGPRNLFYSLIYWSVQQMGRVPWLDRIARGTRYYRTARAWSGPPWLREATDHLLVCSRNERGSP